mgnify:CR=1 FL=1
MCKTSAQIATNLLISQGKQCEQKSVQLINTRCMQIYCGVVVVLPTIEHMFYTTLSPDIIHVITGVCRWLSTISTAPINTIKQF